MFNNNGGGIYDDIKQCDLFQYGNTTRISSF